MKPYLHLALALLVLSGCTPHKKPDEYAQSFFDRGRKEILSALGDVQATPAQLEQARAVLERHQKDVVAGVGNLFRQQRVMFVAVASGKNTEALLAQDRDLHQAHERSMRSFGKLHEELESAVGAQTWKAASARLTEKAVRYMN